MIRYETISDDDDTDLSSTPILSANNAVTIFTKREYLEWGGLWAVFLLVTLYGFYQRLKTTTVSQAHHDPDGRSVAGDTPRRTFHNYLLVALTLRTCLLPLLVYSYHHRIIPRSVQLLADTLPLVAFAVTWAWLVQFFVQLVLTASGSSTSAGDGGGMMRSPRTSATAAAVSSSINSTTDNNNLSLQLTLQLTAYAVYTCLVLSYNLYHEAAAVLLYALLCCVYCALLGTWVYVCPRLLHLLQPLRQQATSATTAATQQQQEGEESALFLRLWVLCGGVFVLLLGETIALARQVLLVFPFSRRPLWALYGCLELLPALTLLILMHPKSAASPASSGSGATAAAGSTLPQYGSTKAGNAIPPMRKSTSGTKTHKMAESAPLLTKSSVKS